ncbi:MAG: hypothetical protein M3Y23_06720, partial [Actinomycetota bacterium]|nr:hypothetical protein [Actinomycetota bacterium]
MKSAAICGLRDRTIAMLAGIVARTAFRFPDRLLDAVAGSSPEVAEGIAPDAWLLARLTSPPAGDSPDPVPAPDARSRRSYELQADAVAARK